MRARPPRQVETRCSNARLPVFAMASRASRASRQRTWTCVAERGPRPAAFRTAERRRRLLSPIRAGRSSLAPESAPPLCVWVCGAGACLSPHVATGTYKRREENTCGSTQGCIGALRGVAMLLCLVADWFCDCAYGPASPAPACATRQCLCCASSVVGVGHALGRRPPLLAMLQRFAAHAVVASAMPCATGRAPLVSSSMVALGGTLVHSTWCRRAGGTRQSASSGLDRHAAKQRCLQTL